MNQKGLVPLLIVIIIALAVGGYLAYSGKINLNRTQTIPSQNTPEMVTQAFYDWYLSCLDKHFTSNTGKSPNEDCSYQTNPNVGPQLQKNLGQPKDSDLVLCAQNTPRSTKVDKAYIAGNKATVVAHTLYDGSGDNPINVDLQLFDNKWKITNISCTHS